MASEIGVQTIQHTNGTDAMTIDSSGRVAQPALPAWSVKFSSGSYVALPVTPAIFDTVVVNRGSIYDTSTGVVTIPVAGVYNIIAMVYARVDVNEAIAVRIMKSTDGGSNYTMETYAYHYPTGVTQIHTTLVNNILLDLNVGDKIRIHVTGDCDYYTGGQETRFSGHLVG